MKVKFKDEFYEELKRIDGLTTLTSYTLEKQTVPDVEVPVPTTKYKFEGILEDNLLNLYFDFPSEFIVNQGVGQAVTAVFNVIRVYSGDKIAFIIYNDDYSNLVFSQTRNLVAIELPAVTLSKVKVQGNRVDTDFLESYGNVCSSNLFGKEGVELVEKESYYKYYLIKLTNPDIFDEFGRKTAENFTFRVYNKIEIQVSNLTEKRIKPDVRYGLDSISGLVRFHGSLDYTEYQVVDGDITEVETGKCGVYGIPGIKIVCVKYKDFGYTIDNNLFEVEYSKKISDNSRADFRFELEYYNHLTSKVEKVVSDPVRLTQQSKNLDWNVVSCSTTNTYKNCPIFLFGYNAYSSGQLHHIYIHTYLGGSVDDIEIDLDEELEDKIDITPVLLSYDNSNDERVYDFIISMKSDNEEDSWFPGDKENIPPIVLRYEDYEVTIYVVQKYNKSGIELEKIITMAESEENDYNKIDSLFFEYDGTSYPNITNLALGASGVDKDNEDISVLGDSKYWKLIDKPSECDVLNGSSESIETGELIYGKSSLTYFEDDGVTQVGRDFQVSLSYTPKDAYDKEIGNLVFRRITEEEKEEEFSPTTTWEEELEDFRISIPVTTSGESVSLVVKSGGVTLSNEGIVNITIKNPDVTPTTDPTSRTLPLMIYSNCKFSARLDHQKKITRPNDRIYFYESGEETYESSSYSNGEGKLLQIVYDNDPSNPSLVSDLVANLTITANVPGKKSESILLYVNVTSQTISLPVELKSTGLTNENYIFLDDFEKSTRKFNCRVFPKIDEEDVTPPISKKNNITCSDPAEVLESNSNGEIQSYSYYTIDFNRESAKSSDSNFPVEIERCYKLSDPSAGTQTPLYYYALPKAHEPDIKIYKIETVGNVSTEYPVYGSNLIIPTGASKVSFRLKSRYKLFLSTQAGQAEPDYISEYHYIYTIQTPFTLVLTDSGVVEDGWHLYILDIKSNLTSLTSKEILGYITLKSSILTERSTDGNDTPLLENIIGTESQPLMQDTFNLDETWVKNTFGYYNDNFYIVQTTENVNDTVKGPNNINLPTILTVGGQGLESGFIDYEGSVYQGEITSTKFMDYAGLSTEISGGFRMSFEDYSEVLREYGYDQPFVIDEDDTLEYINLSMSRSLGFSTSKKDTEFSYTQKGIQDGLFFWCKNINEDNPYLYVDLGEGSPYSESIDISGDCTYLDFEVGLVNISSRILKNQTVLDLNKLSVIIDNSNASYDVTSTSDIYTGTFTKNLRVSFPSNTTDSNKYYTITIIEEGELVSHSVQINVRQLPSYGTVFCSDVASFYSNGICFDITRKTKKYFYFESDIEDLSDFSIVITDTDGVEIDPLQKIKIEEDTDKPVADHTGCTCYKAEIKMYKNISGETFTGYLKFYNRGKSVINPVTLYQGTVGSYVYSPDGNDKIVGKDSDLNVLGIYDVPYNTGSDLQFKYVPFEIEPDGYGGFVSYDSNITITTEGAALWKVSESSIPIESYLETGYKTEIPTEEGVSLDYIKNTYTVKSGYYTQRFGIEIEVTLKATYGAGTPLSGDSLTMKYKIKLNKKRQSTT